MVTKEMEEDTEILYSLLNETQIAFREIMNNSELQQKMTETQINFRRL